MKAVTEGERLFTLIRDRVLDEVGNGGLLSGSQCEALSNLSGSPDFSAYIRGAVAIHALRRLMKYWRSEKESTANEATYIGKVSRFITDEIFPELSKDRVSQLARYVIKASDSSNRTIPNRTRKNVVAEFGTLKCYLCSRDLYLNVAEQDGSFFTLEHIWPSSLGGDSVEENLLPACRECQRLKGDALSWEWIAVHDVVLPVLPPIEALNAIPKRIRIARHFLLALQVCDREGFSWKEALLSIGPMNVDLSHRKTRLPVTFFDLKTM